jgi:trimethylamine--corrinoid protein Co-methyltransferase
MLKATPSIKVLTEAQIQRAHDGSLKILSETGIRVDSAVARSVLAKGDCRVGPDSQVLIPPDRVKWAIEQAPSKIAVYDRTGSPVFTIGDQPGSQTRFGIGATNLKYQDPQTDVITPFSLDHVAIAARLAQGLTQFDLLATPGIAQDDLIEQAREFAKGFSIDDNPDGFDDMASIGPIGNFLLSRLMSEQYPGFRVDLI